MINFDDDEIFFQTVRRLIVLASQLEKLRPKHVLFEFIRLPVGADEKAMQYALYAHFGPPEMDVSEMVRRGAYQYVYTQLLRALEHAVSYPDDPLMIRHDPAEYTRFFN